MYELRLMLLAAFGLTALYCAASTMKIWLRSRRLSYLGGAMATTFGTVALLILIVPAPVQPSGMDEPARADLQGRRAGYWQRYSAAEQAEIEEMHGDLAPALESYRQTHGVYPPTLPVAGIPLPETRHGPIHYYSSRTWYLVSVGDPKMDGFQADWDSRTQKWTVNEFDM